VRGRTIRNWLTKSLDGEVPTSERTAGRALQVPLETRSSLFVGELDHGGQGPRSMACGGWSQAAVVRVDPSPHVCGETDIASFSSRETAEDVDEPLVHGCAACKRQTRGPTGIPKVLRGFARPTEESAPRAGSAVAVFARLRQAAGGTSSSLDYGAAPAFA